MDKIQRVSRYLINVFNTLLVYLPVSVVIQWLFIESDLIKNLIGEGFLQKPISTPEGYVNLSTIHWSLLSKATGFLAQSIGLLPFFLCLFVLKSIFLNYQRGDVFSTINARNYRYLGWLFFLNALLAQPLSNLMVVLAVTLANPPGHRYISLSFGSPNIEALFCGMLVIVISWVMLEASKLHDEQQFTV
ncbi:MAG: DUF2975 domain-containing protein [Parachlamydiaceae bacterium]|nr:DUF2975 domain-containing protein [Parachlamydiaceae bacterium]